METGIGQLAVFTASMGALAVLLSLPPGIVMAFLLARRQWGGKSIVETLVSLPLALPPVATGLILLELFSRRGWLGPLLENLGIEIIFTWKAVVIAMAVMSFPLLVRTARTAFEGVDPRLEGMARTLGAGPIKTFFAISLPLAFRGILSGAILAFARALGEFGATVLVAGNLPGKTTTLSVQIFEFIELGKNDEAVHLMLFSAALSFAAIWLSDRFANQSRLAGNGKP